ncbi:uncharacterized protein [Apostichopus japonicus]|uniref:uncharacterized protein n=1 Tax=Stichopus japonicus TaxID=307972 RepID=UPI003AB4EC64
MAVKENSICFQHLLIFMACFGTSLAAGRLCEFAEKFPGVGGSCYKGPTNDRHDTDSSPSDTFSTSTDTISTSTDTTSSLIETTSTSGAIIPVSTDISSSDDTDSSPSDTISTSTDTISTSTDTTSSLIETTSTSGAIIPTSTDISSSDDTDFSPSDTISTSTDTTSSLIETTSTSGAIIPTSIDISSSDDTDSSPSDTISTSTDTISTSTDTTSSLIETTPTSGAIIPASTDISSSDDTDSSPIDTSSINIISSYNDEIHTTTIPVCDDGMVKCYNGSRLGCAMLEKCVCNLTTADTIISFGGFYVNDNCTSRAHCIHGNVTWDDEYFCSSDATCEERDNVRRCYCVGGYHGDGKTCTRHTNCQDAYNAGKRDGGIYIIKPTNWSGSPFPVYCNMTDGGGWTVIHN